MELRKRYEQWETKKTVRTGDELNRQQKIEEEDSGVRGSEKAGKDSETVPSGDRPRILSRHDPESLED